MTTRRRASATATTGTGRQVRRVLVEPSAYHFLNLGDVAMLQVAVRRLRNLWPEASIEVLIDEPDRLDRYCSGAVPLAADGRNDFLATPPPGDGLWRRLPSPVLRLARQGRLAVRRRTSDDRVVEAFLDAVTGADLVVVSGAGGTADPFPHESHTVLDVLEMAAGAGVPTAMMGQAFGPLEHPRLRRRAREVLPVVDLIALRERRASAPLLEALGVPMERVVTTGDDAIETAYVRRCSGPSGRLIGVNVRIAGYSGLEQDLASEIGRQVLEAGRRHHADLTSVPISLHPTEQDASVIDRVFATSDGATSLPTPEEVIGRVAGCRMVVTGSYHAAVFALSQGIPAVGLARSGYYVDKFCGLADQFGPGCAVVVLEPGWQVRLAGAIDAAWTGADEVRASLLTAAENQVRASEAAYRRLRDLVERR